MTERLDPVVGLRHYFQDLARVAPAEHQLPDVVARTARVAQRPAWRARLPRLGEPEVAGRRMPIRYGLVAISAALLAWSVGVIGGAGSPGRFPFEGHWTSRDTDGSIQLLDVSAGDAPTVRFEDVGASGCAANGDDSIDFIARGTGIVAGDRLVLDFPDGGGCHTWHVPAFHVTYTLDRSTGTMRDSDGVTWRRSP